MKSTDSNFNFFPDDIIFPEIPKLAQGKVDIGNIVARTEYEQLKAEAERKKQFRHDWLIASFSVVTGAISGFLGSLLFWLISK